MCLCGVVSRTATWGTYSAPASLSREAVLMTKWNTAQPCCPAVPSTPTLSSPTPWPSAATVGPAGLTAMNAHTGPARTELGVPNQSDVSTRIPTRATTWSRSDLPVVSAFILLSFLFLFFPLKLPGGNCMIHQCFGSRHTSSFSLWWRHWCLSSLCYLLYQPVLLCLCCPTQVILLGIFISVIINPTVHSCVCDLSCLLWKGYSEFN